MDARKVEDKIIIELKITEAKKVVKEYDDLQPAHQQSISLKHTHIFKPKYPMLKNLVKFIRSCFY